MTSTTEDEDFHAFVARLDVSRAFQFSGIYLASFLMLGVDILKSVVIAAILLVCWLGGTGRRAVTRVGILLFPYAVAVWIGAAPAPGEVRAFLSSTARAICGITGCDRLSTYQTRSCSALSSRANGAGWSPPGASRPRRISWQYDLSSADGHG